MKLPVYANAPHIHHKLTNLSSNLLFTLALMPAFVYSVFLYGYAKLWLLIVVLAGVLLAAALGYLFKRYPLRACCLSSLPFAVLWALIFPLGSLWPAFISSFLAIFISRQVFGGFGNALVNPAVVAYSLSAMLWPNLFWQPQPLAPLNYDWYQWLLALPSDSFLAVFVHNFMGINGGAIINGSGLLVIAVIFIWLFKLRSPLITIMFLVIYIFINYIFNFDILFNLSNEGFLVGLFILASANEGLPHSGLGGIIYAVLLALLTILLGPLVNGDIFYAIFVMSFVNLLINTMVRYLWQQRYQRIK
ncbi:MAG: RnfABCDGE type electron transport complex subunit D [Spirochaetaceae bacterium]|nr:RnfABCDGE type electron transport complex subunit D [Spirochaetaceae bacterium]